MQRLLAGLTLIAAVACGAGDQPDRARAIRECGIREGLPESRAFTKCLIDHYGWAPDSANAFVVASAESLQAIRDSLARVAADSVARELLALQDAQRFADSVRAARAEAEWRRLQAEASERDLAVLWVGSDSTGMYYRGNCATARKITGNDRYQWHFEAGPKNAGFKRSTDPGC